MRHHVLLASTAFVLAVFGVTLLGFAAVSAAQTLLFGAPSNYRVSAFPNFIAAAADLNRDGKPDLVTANSDIGFGSPAPANVSVILASGGGRFQSGVDYAVSGTPWAVAIGDLNGDSNPDLATANGLSDTVSVLLGKGDGTFGTKTNFAAPTDATGIAIADLSGDGKPDLAASSQDTNQVSVLLGNGNGTFGAATRYPAGSQASFVAAGDLNGDGKADVVTAGFGSAQVSVLLGKGDGTLQPPVDYVVQANQYPSVAIGDLNADGKPDLATSNHEANTISVLLGNGDGTFQPAVNYAAGPATPDTVHSVVLGDMNGDGKPDIVTGSHSLVYLLIGHGDGTFDPAVSNYTGGKFPAAIALADFNGDGRKDFATANYMSNNVSIRLGLANQAPKPACLVPNVRGKTLPVASRRVKAAHCRVGKVKRAHSKTFAKGRVISEKPRATTRLALGGKVNLVVSLGRKR